MLQFLIFLVHFMCLMELPIAYKPSRPIPLDPISHGNEGCFTTEQLSMEICHRYYRPY